MKILCRFLLVLITLITLTATAQDKPVYAMITYMKVDRGQSATYLDLVKNYGSKIYTERIKTGEIVSWSLFSVPTSSEPNEYNFVAVTQANSIQTLMNLKTPKEIGKTAMPNTPDILIDEISKKYAEIRVVVYSSVCKLLDRLPSTGDSKYYNIAYMKVPYSKVADYVKLESETYKPLHKERQAAGEISAWALWDNSVLTSGENAPYNYVTANGFNDYDKFVNSNYAAVYKKVFPNGDIVKLTAQTIAARTMVKSEIWKSEVRLNQASVK